MRVLCGNLQRGDGFQACLDVLLLSAVPDARFKFFLLSSLMGGQLILASDVLSSSLKPLDRSLPAALGAWRRGGGDISAGGRQRV